MTEKRFQIIHLGNPYDFVVKDYATNKTYGTLQGDDKSLTELLIELHEENEVLKARITYLERKIQRERASVMKQHEKWDKEAQDKINHLHEENTRLRNEIQDFQNLLTEREETFLKPIHLALDDAIENERTALGKSALKQFKQTIME